MSDIASWGLLEAGRRILAREVSALEVTRALLERIERLDGRYHAFAHVMAEHALADAERADREMGGGIRRGPLHGVPVAVKDLLTTAGAPTTAGSIFLGEKLPREDAAVIRRLRAAGAVLLGKLRMTEGAMNTHHPALPAPVNPWAADITPGFSSSGSAVAVAIGECAGAIGTDTGGSIRLPAAINNLVGLKPTWGRVSLAGSFPLVALFDTIGPIARDVADVAALLDAISGGDAGDTNVMMQAPAATLSGIEGGITRLTVGIDPAFTRTHGRPAVVAMMECAASLFADLGCTLREVALPKLDLAAIYPVIAGGIAASHRDHFDAHVDDYAPDLAEAVRQARAVPATAVADAAAAARLYALRMEALFGDIDLLLLPTIGIDYPGTQAIGGLSPEAAIDVEALFRFSMPFNVSGSPALTLPGGFDDGGLPMGIQLAARPSADGLLLRAGHAWQQATDWHRRRPPLSSRDDR